MLRNFGSILFKRIILDMLNIKIGYFKCDKGNVGDDLNIWLWPKLLSNVKFTEDSDHVLVGIGSVLDSRFDHYKNKYLLGAGARNNHSIPTLDDTWHALFVRGPKTQAALAGQREVNFITDPAILVGEYYKQVDSPSEIGLIPYFRSNQKLWENIAHKLGYKLISPCSSVEEFSQAISECKFVVTEAMHGAIFADSIRVPWYSFSSLTRHYEQDTHLFKWKDWCLSMNLTFNELELPMIWEKDNAFTRWLKQQLIISKLKKITLSDCYLSTNECFKNKTQEMKTAIMNFFSL